MIIYTAFKGRSALLGATLFVFFLLTWEACFQFGISDPYLYSVPSVILALLFDFAYIRTVIVYLFQVLLVSSVGGLGGLISAVLLSRNRFLTKATISFAETAVWLPFLLPWSLPIWPVRPHNLASTIVPIWFTGIVAVGLWICLQYLLKRTLLNQNWRAVRIQLVRESLLQGAFISLIAQVWIRPYGWNWFMHTPSDGAASGFAALLLLGLFQTVVYDIAPVDADDETQTHRILIDRFTLSAASAIIPWILVVIIWHVLSVTGLAWLVSHPLLVLLQAYDLLAGAYIPLPNDNAVWSHLAFSSFELVCGLACAVAVVLLTARETSGRLKKLVEPIIVHGPLVVMVVPVFFVYWTPSVAVPLVAILSALVLSLRPMMNTLEQNFRTLKMRGVLIATREALPLAFVGILFGEAIAGVKGLGFLMMTALHYPLPLEVPIAISTICFLFFVITSLALKLAIGRT